MSHVNAGRAKRRTNQDRKEHGFCAKGCRNGERLGEEFAHGKIAPMEARPKISMGEALQIKPELLHEWQVEEVDPAQVLGDLRIERPLRIKWPAGREAHQEKRKGDDNEKRRDRRRDASKKITKHSSTARGLPIC
ncbi:MAG: hypothetical protein ACREDV_11930 [Methylocella sp.]